MFEKIKSFFLETDTAALKRLSDTVSGMNFKVTLEEIIDAIQEQALVSDTDTDLFLNAVETLKALPLEATFIFTIDGVVKVDEFGNKIGDVI